MKAIIINKTGAAWNFPTIADARRHVKTAKKQDYEIKTIHGEKVAVWDDRP